MNKSKLQVPVTLKKGSRTRRDTVWVSASKSIGTVGGTVTVGDALPLGNLPAEIIYHIATYFAPAFSWKKLRFLRGGEKSFLSEDTLLRYLGLTNLLKFGLVCKTIRNIIASSNSPREYSIWNHLIKRDMYPGCMGENNNPYEYINRMMVIPYGLNNCMLWSIDRGYAPIFGNLCKSYDYEKHGSTNDSSTSQIFASLAARGRISMTKTFMKGFADIPRSFNQNWKRMVTTSCQLGSLNFFTWALDEWMDNAKNTSDSDDSEDIEGGWSDNIKFKERENIRSVLRTATNNKRMDFAWYTFNKYGHLLNESFLWKVFESSIGHDIHFSKTLADKCEDKRKLMFMVLDIIKYESSVDSNSSSSDEEDYSTNNLELVKYIIHSTEGRVLKLSNSDCKEIAKNPRVMEFCGKEYPEEAKTIFKNADDYYTRAKINAKVAAIQRRNNLAKQSVMKANLPKKMVAKKPAAKKMPVKKTSGPVKKTCAKKAPAPTRERVQTRSQTKKIPASSSEESD